MSSVAFYSALAKCLPRVHHFSLRVASEGQVFSQIDLSELPVVVGRGNDCDVDLNDPWVSRRHCEIDMVDGQLLIRDLGSKHGTYVNDQAIVERLLRVGDRLGIGLTDFVVEET